MKPNKIVIKFTVTPPPLKTKAQYKKALKRFEQIFNPKTKAEVSEAKLLSVLIKNYEDKNFVIAKPSTEKNNHIYWE